MPTAWLCRIDAFARDNSAVTTIRLASHDDDRLCHLDAATWWPCIARLPTFAYDFFDGAFGGDIVAPSGRADIAIEAVPGYATLMLHGARVRWYFAELGAAWEDYTLQFDGLIDNQPTIREGVAGIEFRVDDRWMDLPILNTYGGAGGAEGEIELKGQVKPLMLGAPVMTEGVLVDSIDTIIQLNDGPMEGVDVAFEGAARFDDPVADYDDFGDLDAATIAPGFVATAIDEGFVRHGAPGAGVLTYNVRGSNAGSDGGGWVRRTGAIVKRIAARLGKSDKLDVAALTAIDTARPWNVSLALLAQVTPRELFRPLAQSINAVHLVTWTGALTILPIDPPEEAEPVGTLSSDGSTLPPVAKVEQLGIAPPFWRVATEAEITQRVLSPDEVAYYDVPVIEKTVYKRAASAPATPSGGYYNYLTGETTPPTDWYADIGSVPASGNPLYASSAVATRSPTAGNAPFGAWSAPGILAQNGANGANGSNGAPGAPGSPGTNGADAKLIFVASTHQTFRYDTAGSPLSQTTTITATRQNTAGTTEWRLLEADGTALTGWLTAASMVTNGGANSSPNNDTLVIDQTQFTALLAFASTPGLIYEARMSGATSVQDRISIVRVQDGAEGAAPFALAAFNSNSQVSGNRLIKVAGATGWNASTHSTNSFKGGASVSFVIDTAASFMVGLNSDPTADADYTSLDFAIYIAGPTTLQVYESGSLAYSNGGATNNVGDVYTVTYNGKSVVYSRNGVAFYTNSAPAANLTLFVDSSFYTAAPVTFGRIMSFTGVGVPGTDGDDGANGLSIAASKPILTVARTGSGTVKSGELPKSTQMIVYDGFTDITASCTYSRTTHNCSVSNDGGGAFTLTAVSAADAYFDVTAEAPDGREITMRIPTSQAADGPAASRASNALSTMTTSGSFVQVGSVDIVAAAGTTISGAGSTTYQATNTGAGVRTVRAEAKISIQNVTDSGAESDGSSVIGSAASYIAGDGPSDIGSVSAGHSVTNSTGGPKMFRVRFYVRKYDGLANINTTGGTYAGTVAVEVA